MWGKKKRTEIRLKKCIQSKTSRKYEEKKMQTDFLLFLSLHQLNLTVVTLVIFQGKKKGLEKEKKKEKKRKEKKELGKKKRIKKKKRKLKKRKKEE